MILESYQKQDLAPRFKHRLPRPHNRKVILAIPHVHVSLLNFHYMSHTGPFADLLEELFHDFIAALGLAFDLYKTG
jgi:hypothetical protein